jgi:hypothetical protein
MEPVPVVNMGVVGEGVAQPPAVVADPDCRQARVELRTWFTLPRQLGAA